RWLRRGWSNGWLFWKRIAFVRSPVGFVPSTVTTNGVGQNRHATGSADLSGRDRHPVDHDSEGDGRDAGVEHPNSGQLRNSSGIRTAVHAPERQHSVDG